jgi:uncharacterized protein
MLDRMSFRGKWVLVTGASSGLGLEMARVLARDHGANVVLVARRRERLDELAKELRTAHRVEAEVLCADLCRPEDVERVFEEGTRGRSIYAAILNAGVTFYGLALEQPWEAFQSMLATNVTSVVRLTNLFLPYLEKQGHGGAVMLVSSMAGFMPMPYQAAYGGTKAFITSYGQSMAEEIRDRNISLTVFAPGGIATEMLDNLKQFKPGDLGIMAAEPCAILALRAMADRKDVYVPGGLNQVTAAVTKVLPRQFLVGRIAALYKGGLGRE